MRGFTLIELMIVIAILGILAAIGVSGLKEHSEPAIKIRIERGVGIDCNKPVTLKQYNEHCKGVSQ